MLDKSMDPKEKLRTALELYFPGVRFSPEVTAEAVQAMLWFYRCGADEEPAGAGQGGGAAEDPPYSYEYDADYIYAAFLGSFGIDLARTSLHWWQFRAVHQDHRVPHNDHPGKDAEGSEAVLPEDEKTACSSCVKGQTAARE